MDFDDNFLNTNYNIDKNKFIDCQKKILFLEQNYILNIIRFIDYKKIDKIQKNISNYKLVIDILYSSPEFYYELKYILIDYSRDLNEVSYLEIIWDNEHYEYIEKIKTYENDILELIKFSNKYNLITYIQYIFVKKTLKKMNEIFESDKSISKLYEIKSNKTTSMTKKHLELFFDILDIILLKINLSKKTNYKISDIFDISTNYKYTNLIKKIKLNLEKQKINI